MAALETVYAVKEWVHLMQNKPNIKAVFFDIDGTLLSHKLGDIPASARRAVKALREKGIHCVIASGRHLIQIKTLPLRDMEFDGFIMLNGQLCADNSGELFFANPITGDALENILQIFHGNQICMMLIEKDTMYLNFVDDNVRKAQASISTPVAPLGEYTGKPIYQAITYLEAGGEAAFADKVPGCFLTRWNPNAVDIICESGGKEAGILAYLEKNGIRREETMAFGDAVNDLGMLRLAGIGVCMGNGSPDIQAQADYVTASVEEDGIEKALQHFGLI